MGKKPNRLGRGLNSLISSSLLTETKEQPADIDAATESKKTDDLHSETPPGRIDSTASDKPHRIAIEGEHSSAGASRIIGKLAQVPDSRTLTADGQARITQGLLGTSSQELLDIPVDSIVPNVNQPRKSFDAVSIGRLARSIAESGVLQPLLIRRVQDVDSDQSAVKYELIAGERRLRAAKAAGISKVPAILKPVDSDASMELALVENIQREDLNAIDRARAYRAFCDRIGLTAEEASRRLGEDRSTVSNYLRLLELPDSVMTMVEAGQISMGHARALLGSPDSATQSHLAKRAISEGLSVRAIEKLVRAARPVGPGTTAAKQDVASCPGYLSELEEKLQLAAKTKVSIQPSRTAHRGKIVIEYYTLDDFDRIAAMLGYSGDGAV